MGRAGRTLDEDAVALLVAHEWPGNIRELINIVRRMLVMTTGTRLTAADVPAKLQQAHSTFVDDEDSFTGEKARMNLEFEQTYIDSLVRTCKGDVSAAARLSKLSRQSIYRMLERHGVDPNQYRNASHEDG